MVIIIKSKKYGNKECSYDDVFHPIISSFKWNLQKKRNTFYAITKGLRPNGTIGTLRMHRLILTGGIIDHKDQNGLNNYSANLRVATNSQNMQNRGPTKTNKLGFKGVYPKNNGYCASIRNKENVLIYLGSFKTPVEAAKRFNQEAIKLHGEFVWLNPV